jgi:hypothetical protein
MERCTGPECPECGCQQSEVLSEKVMACRRREGVELEFVEMESIVTKRECQNCFLVYTISTPWKKKAKQNRQGPRW